MGVEAARLALRSAPADAAPDALWFSTASPAYLDKNNASTLHAALRLDTDVVRVRLRRRAALGHRRAARRARRQRPGPGRHLRSARRPARRAATSRPPATARARCSSATTPTAPSSPSTSAARAPPRSSSSAGARPGSTRSRAWEERFGEVKYGPLVEQAWNAALKSAELSRRPGRDASSSPACTPAPRAAVSGRLGTAKEALVDDRAATVGNTGSAHAALLLADTLESAQPGQVIALVVLADGADVLLFRTTDAIASYAPARTVAAQIDGAADLPYGKFLSWRGEVTARAAPPPRARPHLGVGVGPHRGLEVRVRRLARPEQRRAAHAARARLARRRRGRRHAARADGRRAGHDRAVHHRPHRVLAEPAGRVRGRRLGRRRPPAGRAHRRRRATRCRWATGSR